MTPEQARKLAALIIDTWPTRVIKAYIWTEALAELDHQPALGVYEYLRDTDEHPPTVARFLAIYRSNTPDYGWQTPVDDTDPVISLDEYLHQHPEDEHLRRTRERHPTWLTH